MGGDAGLEGGERALRASGDDGELHAELAEDGFAGFQGDDLGGAGAEEGDGGGDAFFGFDGEDAAAREAGAVGVVGHAADLAPEAPVDDADVGAGCGEGEGVFVLEGAPGDVVGLPGVGDEGVDGGEEGDPVGGGVGEGLRRGRWRRGS